MSTKDWIEKDFYRELGVASGASAESVAAVISKDPNVTFAQPVAP